MIENLDNVFSRISEIQNRVKAFSGAAKPARLKEFENMLYKEQISTGNVKKQNRFDPAEREAELKQVVAEKELSTSMLDKKLETKTIDDAIKTASVKYSVAEDIIRAVISMESAYDTRAVSRAGAMGLMQLMPKTALELGVEKPFDIEQNIDGGVKYLRMMLDRYDGSLEKALAAYNAGPHNVDAANGIPDFSETINYVKKIKSIIY